MSKQFMWIGYRASRAIFIFRYIQSWLLIFKGDLVIVSWRNSGLNQNKKPHRALWQSPWICTGRDPALLMGNDSQEMCPDKALLPWAVVHTSALRCPGCLLKHKHYRLLSTFTDVLGRGSVRLWGCNYSWGDVRGAHALAMCGRSGREGNSRNIVSSPGNVSGGLGGISCCQFSGTGLLPSGDIIRLDSSLCAPQRPLPSVSLHFSPIPHAMPSTAPKT